MITSVFLAFVAIATMFAFFNWRIGVGLWMVIAILQDPIRKITPGNPVYLTVAFLPVYFATFLSLLLSKNVIKAFAQEYSPLARLFQTMIAMLLFSAVYGFTASHKSVMASMIGIGSYVGGLPAILCGYAFLKKDYRFLDWLILGFVAATSIMLIGVPLEHFGYKFSRPWLGTFAATAGETRRWFNDFDYVEMISGFYRSPEIMGWHAMVLIICSFYLFLRRPSYAVIWTALATWGCYGVFLSGRRKMLLMLFVFVGTFLTFSTLRNRKRILKALVLTSTLMVPGMLFFVNDLYRMSLSSGVDTVGGKVAGKMMTGPIWLATIVGPFGFGVGTLTQGAQHFRGAQNFTQSVYIPLVEGGMEKVMVEVGLVGLSIVMLLGVQLVIDSRRSLRLGQRFLPKEFGPGFCFSYIAANASAFLIAFQFLGDPFIGTFLGLFIGMLLSTNRIIKSQQPKTVAAITTAYPNDSASLRLIATAGPATGFRQRNAD